MKPSRVFDHVQLLLLAAHSEKVRTESRRIRDYATGVHDRTLELASRLFVLRKG